jgi:transcriptional regulator with XRE-family HTH domain
MQKSPFSDAYHTFLTLLRSSREEASLTQSELAVRMGVTQSFVSKCERGERRIDIIELYVWCDALDLLLPDFVQRLSATLSSEERSVVSDLNSKRSSETATVVGPEDL